jgi:hypothetical protein
MAAPAGIEVVIVPAWNAGCGGRLLNQCFPSVNILFNAWKSIAGITSVYFLISFPKLNKSPIPF